MIGKAIAAGAAALEAYGPMAELDDALRAPKRDAPLAATSARRFSIPDGAQ